jgi:DNA-binding protein YbaB
VTTVSETVNRDANNALRERLADVYGRYARLRSDLDGLAKRLASLEVSASSPDGFVHATVGSRGQLIGLDIDRHAGRELDPDRLARTIVATVQQAAARTAGEVERLMSGYLPADSGTMQFLRDNEFSSLMRRPDAIMRSAVPDFGGSPDDPSSFSPPERDSSSFSRPDRDLSSFSRPDRDPSSFSRPDRDPSSFGRPDSDRGGSGRPDGRPDGGSGLWNAAAGDV